MIKQIAGLVLLDGNKVLLQLRDDKPGIEWPGGWSIPGGAANSGELPMDAAIREFEEETGYKAGGLKLVAKLRHVKHKEKRIYNVYWTEYDRKQQIQCYEGQRMKWFELEKALTLKLIPVVKRALIRLRR